MLAAAPVSRPVGAFVNPSSLLNEISAALGARGLRLRGGFALVQDLDQAVLDHAPRTRTLLLVGNVGSELWERSGQAILAMGEPDPLDRWTRREIAPIAAAHGGTALFPFDGPPYWPFQRWAARAEGVSASPLGILIHPEFGLWHAYRAAILLPLPVALPAPGNRPHPCDACADRPCLSTCPVGAFTDNGYDVDHCARHVKATMLVAGDCYRGGCRARLACPVGAAWRYQADHAGFHMRAFLAARMGVLPKS